MEEKPVGKSYDAVFYDDVINEAASVTPEQWKKWSEIKLHPRWKYKHREWKSLNGTTFWVTKLRWIWKVLGLKGVRVSGMGTAWKANDLYNPGENDGA